MSKQAEIIEAARREFVAALGTPQEQEARERLQRAIEQARKAQPVRS
jgi:hypothetical protein